MMLLAVGASMADLIDITGQRFGYLIALEHVGHVNGHALWRCRCDCGEVIEARSEKLRCGRRLSCGRGGHRYFRRLLVDGGPASSSSEYKSWMKMRERCNNEGYERYAAYGGRGIVVCDRWSSFENFYLDMGDKPTPAHTIDRIDNDGPYSPENCRWATRAEQRRNMRSSVYIEYGGRRLLLMDLAAELGLSRSNIYSRLRLGWTLERAITVPVRRRRPPLFSAAESAGLTGR